MTTIAHQPRGFRAATRLAVTSALVVASSGVLAQGADSSSWQLVGVQGLVQVVIVPKDHVRDASAYKAQIAKLCPPERTCFVNFYENSTGAKAELPLPDAIAAEATARFRRSVKNGAELFQWSCRLAASANDAQCF